jgi:hypothetical protein
MNLSIDLSDPISWSLKVSCSHVYSSTINVCNLNLRNQLESYFFIIESNEPKASTSLIDRIPDDLSLLDLTKLFEMLLKHLVTKLVV